MRYVDERKRRRTIIITFAIVLFCGVAGAQTGGFLPDALEGQWQIKGGSITFVKTASGWTGKYDDFRQSFPPIKDIKFDPASGKVSFTTPPGSLGKPEMRWAGTIFRHKQSNGCSIVGALEYEYIEGKTTKRHSVAFEAGSTYHGKGPVGKNYTSRCFSKEVPGVTPPKPDPTKKPSEPPGGKVKETPSQPTQPASSFWGNWTLSSGGRIGQPDERKAAYVGTISFSPGTGNAQASYKLGGDQGTLEDVVISGSTVRFKRRMPGFFQFYEGTMKSQGKIEGSFDHKGVKFRWWATR